MALLSSSGSAAQTLERTSTQPGALARRNQVVRARDALRRRLLALADVVAAVCFLIGLRAAGATQEELAAAAVLLPVWPFLAKLHGLYDRDHRALYTTTADELIALAGWGIVGTAIVAAVSSALSHTDVSFAVLGWGWATVTVTAALLRATVRIAWRLLAPRDRTLVVGGGELAQTVRRKIELLPQLHQEIVGTCAPEELEAAIAAGTLPAGLDRILFASRSLDESAIAMLVGLCRREGMKLSVVPPGQTHLGGGVQLSRAADLPVLDYNTWDASRSTLALKRALDVVFGSVTLAVMAPLMALTALAILVDSGRPILFRQRRVGRDGRTFRIVKFRTMCTDAEERLAELVDPDRLPEPVFKLRFDPRVTRVGRFLRRFSLDELPQLVNVLRGQMSLVGPRPEQIELVERWGADQEIRLRVRPGMTGPMQIYGRGELTLVERLTVERDYVENLSLRRDLKILALTLPAVLAGRGAF